MAEEHSKEKEKTNPSKLNIWERIGIISTVVAVIGALIFGVWDKWDYKKQIAKTAYDKLYSDVSQGHYSGTKLVEAINEIYEHGDDLTGMNLSRKWLRRTTILKEKNLYAINLDYSNLQGANLRETLGLTIEQFSKVKNLCNARLDDDLMKLVDQNITNFCIDQT